MGEEKKEKPTQKKVLDEGRFLAPISRKDPELFEAIKEFAEVENVNTVDATVMILKRWFLAQKIEQSRITVNQLLVAWDILREMMKMNIWMFTSMAQMFFSEMTQAIGEIVNQRVSEMMSASKEEKKVQSTEVKEMLINKLLVPMLESMLSNINLMGSNRIVKNNSIPVELKISGKDGDEQGVADIDVKEDIQEVKS